VASIDREDCRRVRQVLEDLAPNYTLLPATRGRSMGEAARILAAGGSRLGPEHPDFPEARDKIARAFVWANLMRPRLLSASPWTLG
jgi:hypothetical protein